MINEVIWRTQTEAIWVWFKTSLFVVFLLFSIALTPYLLKHILPDEDDKPVVGDKPDSDEKSS